MANIYRAETKKSGRSYFKILFLLTANLFLLYLFIDLEFILYAVGLFGGILLILVLVKFIKAYRKMGPSKSKSINSDLFKVSLKYINMNKIYVIATVVGLVLAAVVASQAVLVSSSYQNQMFDEYLQYQNNRALEFRLDSFNDIEILDNWIEYFKDINQIIAENEMTLNYTTTTMQLINEIIVGEPEERLPDGLYQPTYRVQVLEYTEEIFNLYSSLPSFDSTIEYNPSGSILTVSDYYAYNESSLMNNETIDILTDSAFKLNTNDSFNTITLHDVIYFSPTDQDYQYYWESRNNIMNYDFYPFSEHLFLNQSAIDKLMFDIWDILSDIEPGSEDWFWFDVSATSSVYIDLPEITSSNINTLISKLSRLENDAHDFASTFEQSNGLWIRAYSPLYRSLENYMFEAAGINTIILLVTGPLIALALFLVYFSLTLVEQRKQRVIAILKVRGSSKDQLHAMMLSEALIAAIIAVVIGMVLSIPWTLLSLKASGILQFDNPAIPISIPVSWFWRLPFIGIIFSLNLNISSISSLSSISIDEGEVTEEKKKPIWQRMYLDLILVGISIIFWISIQFISGELAFLKNILVIIIGPITMIIFLIGIPLVTARYFSSIIGKISDILWKNFSGMVALATRNMRKNKFSASRLVSFLLLGMMLSYVSLIIPTTFIDWNAEYTAYSMGSEIYISGLDSSNATQLGFLDIPEIDAYSEVVKLYFQTGSNSRIETYTILGVDTETFGDAAFWRDNYDDKSLSSILDKVDSNSSIGMQTQTMQAMGVEIDDYVSIDIMGSTTSFEFNVTTSYEYFPNLVRSLPYMQDNGNYYAWRGYGLITLDMAKTMSNYTQDYEIGTYVNVKDSANATALAISLRELFSSNSAIHIRSIDESTNNLMEDPIVKLLLSSLQGMTIITVIASIMAVSYFSFISLSERKREIGVFRALGMIRNQIFILLVAEVIVILSMGIFVGGIAGYAIVYIFFQFVYELFGQGGGEGVPPLRIITPWVFVAIFTLLMFVLTLVAAAAPAQYTAKQQTGSILRAE